MSDPAILDRLGKDAMSPSRPRQHRSGWALAVASPASTNRATVPTQSDQLRAEMSHSCG
jgi:hypothetical protein